MYKFCFYALAKERRCPALRKTGVDLPSFLQDVLKIRNKDTYRMISDHAKILQFNNKETIYRPYDLDSRFCYLIKGKARAYVIDENGHDLTFRFAYTPGDILLNENDSIKDGSYYWESIGRTWVLLIDKDVMKDAMHSDPNLRSYMISYFQECYADQSALHYSLVTMHAKERYQWFMDYYEDFPSEIPQKYVASFLNMLLQTLSEVRSKLQNS